MALPLVGNSWGETVGDNPQIGSIRLALWLSPGFRLMPKKTSGVRGRAPDDSMEVTQNTSFCH